MTRAELREITDETAERARIDRKIDDLVRQQPFGL
jgi:hypothetical protein